MHTSARDSERRSYTKENKGTWRGIGGDISPRKNSLGIRAGMAWRVCGRRKSAAKKNRIYIRETRALFRVTFESHRRYKVNRRILFREKQSRSHLVSRDNKIIPRFACESERKAKIQLGTCENKLFFIVYIRLSCRVYYSFSCTECKHPRRPSAERSIASNKRETRG